MDLNDTTHKVGRHSCTLHHGFTEINSHVSNLILTAVYLGQLRRNVVFSVSVSLFSCQLKPGQRQLALADRYVGYFLRYGITCLQLFLERQSSSQKETSMCLFNCKRKAAVLVSQTSRLQWKRWFFAVNTSEESWRIALRSIFTLQTLNKYPTWM